MKVLMPVFNTFENDARVWRTASTLAAWGFSVQIVALYREGLPESETIEGVVIKRISSFSPKVAKDILSLLRRVVSRIRRTFLSSAWLDGAVANAGFKKRKCQAEHFADKCLEIAREYMPDVVHGHDFHGLLAAVKINNILNTPYVYDSHELWLERNRGHILTTNGEKQWESEVERDGIKKAAVTITVCDSIADYLKDFYGILRPVVVRNTPYRHKASSKGLGEKSLRSRLNIPKGEFVLLYVGKVTFGRGIGDILSAVSKILAPVKVVFLGSVSESFRKDFEKLIAENNVASKVLQFGPVPTDEVSEWASSADLSLVTMSRVCLSYTFTLPNKLFESVQAGLPIIGPDSPEILALVNRYKLGRTYRDGDVEDLRKQIEFLLANPQELAVLREGAKNAGEDLCWENEREVLRGAYKKVFPSFSSLHQPASATLLG